MRTLARIEQWAQATASGDLAEVEGLDERSPVIPLVTSTRDNCLGAECPEFRGCHVVKARREAMAADLVVVNHHLFFADLALRDSGVAELLPTVEVAVFDEAHQLVEAGVQFLGTTLGTRAGRSTSRATCSAPACSTRAAWSPGRSSPPACDRAARELRLAAAGPLRELRGMLKLRWDERAARDDFVGALAALAARLRRRRRGAGHGQRDGARLRQARTSAPTSWPARARRFAQRGRPTATCAGSTCRRTRRAWSSRRWTSARRCASRWRAAPKAWIFTSATLGDDERLTWFTEPAGLTRTRTLRVGSPFDYAAQRAAVRAGALSRSRTSRGHPVAVAALAARCARALGGRTFVLTTTLRVLPRSPSALRAAFDGAGDAIAVLVQGSAPKRQLLQRFLDRSAAPCWSARRASGRASTCPATRCSAC